MCGIIGLFYSDSTSHVSQGLVDALTVLQHRGQDAAGIVTIKNNRLNLIKENGTVADVFTQANITSLQGNIGIGHVRYPTAGGSCSSEAQPFYTNAPFGIALAHNGNLTNCADLRKALEEECRHTNTDSDSEILLNVFAEELQRRLRSRKLSAEDIFDTVRTVSRRCKGGYAVIMVINNIGLLAFRDPYGIRPLCYGSRRSAKGTDYVIASESVAIDILGPQFHFERDVRPGEAIFINAETGLLQTEIVHVHPTLSPCLFEYVYFARPDSMIDGVSVYEARINMGQSLAEKILHSYPDLDIDVVIPIPETSRTSALQCAHVLRKPYREGFVKNRYIARTFIMPGQEMRRKTVRLKLNTIRSEFKNKNVLLVDDSIVRGTTSFELIQMARDAGARQVYFASAAPPVKYPNVYGIDIPTKSELIAWSEPDEEAIARALNADQVIYNNLEDVIKSVTSLNPAIKMVDASCFNGVYITGDITPEYLEGLEKGRGKNRKVATESTTTTVTGSPMPIRVPVPPVLIPSFHTSHTFTTLNSQDMNSSGQATDLHEGHTSPPGSVHNDEDINRLAESTPQPSDDGSHMSSAPSSPLLNHTANSISSNSLVSFDSSSSNRKGACESIHNGNQSPQLSGAAKSSKRARLV